MLRNSALNVLRCNHLITLPACTVSTKYQIPKPRPYRRRLFEAAVKPVVPAPRSTCLSYKEFIKNVRKQYEEYSDIELALVEHVKQWIKNENFRMIAFCQFLPVKGSVRWLAANQFRLKGLEFRAYGTRIIRKMFENTPLQSLDVIYDVPHNCFLFGKELDSIRAVIKECKKYSWIEPLAITFDSRILSISEAESLCKLQSFEAIRAETIQILESFSHQMLSSISFPYKNLSAALGSIGFALKIDAQTKK